MQRTIFRNIEFYRLFSQIEKIHKKIETKKYSIFFHFFSEKNNRKDHVLIIEMFNTHRTVSNYV